MDVFNGDNALTGFGLKKPSAVVIGNFDGLHRGHRSLIDQTAEKAQELGGETVALTFSPHPDVFFGHMHPQEQLFTPSQKERAFREAGVGTLVVLTFDQQFASLTHNSFYSDVLKGNLRSQHIVIGENFRFGCSRQGDAAFLMKQGARDSIGVTIGRPVTLDGSVVSSTRIRSLLREGRVDVANTLLGRPYLVEGTIRSGDKIGRTLDFPTANLYPDQQLLPKNGVYYGYVDVDSATPKVLSPSGNALPAVFNLGVRPTVDGTSQRFEAHILDWSPSRDLTGSRAAFYLAGRIRDEQKFASLTELRSQIGKDVAFAKQLLGT